MKYKLLTAFSILVAVLNFPLFGLAQKDQNKPTKPTVGHLFIIGGGEKTEGLMRELLKKKSEIFDTT